MKRARFAVAALIAFSSQACHAAREEISLTIKNDDGSGTPEISAEIANSASERQLGLMYRKELPETHGMLFVFPDDVPRAFWMKNTYVELDMVFIDSERKVVSIVERARPHTETPRKSLGPARYVLEIRGGLAAKWGIKPGSRLEVSGQIPSVE